MSMLFDPVEVDDPILSKNQDELARDELAEHTADHIFKLSHTQGLVVGILGPWGSGKTSFLSLLRPYLKEKYSADVLSFSPWMFNGVEQLTQAFFSELSAQLKRRDYGLKIGKALAEYGAVFASTTWIPVLGPVVSGIGSTASALGENLKKSEKSLEEIQNKLKLLLQNLDHPLVVEIDDIDRLTRSEIEAVFKLVRLNASLPNMIYILTFDRHRVEDALEAVDERGRLYLEKILQLVVDIPVASIDVIKRRLEQQLKKIVPALRGNELTDDQVKRWGRIQEEIVEPLLKNLRDVSRYTSSVIGSVQALNNKVDVIDILALEAVRVFLPDHFRALDAEKRKLTGRPTFAEAMRHQMRKSSLNHPKVEVDKPLSLNVGKDELEEKLREHLFPFSVTEGISGRERDEAQRFRRVADFDILRLYLERVAGIALDTLDAAEQAINDLSEGKPLLISTYSAEDQMQILQRLMPMFSGLEAQAYLPALAELFNSLAWLPAIQDGYHFPNKYQVVSSIAQKAVQNMPVHDIELVVAEVLSKIKSLYARLIFLYAFSNHEAGEILPQSFIKPLWDQVIEEATLAEPQILAQEPDLLQLVKRIQDAHPNWKPPRSREVDLKLIQSAAYKQENASLDGVWYKPFYKIYFDILAKALGGESEIQDVLNQFSDDQVGFEMKKSFHLYLSGWRPDPIWPEDD